MSEVRRTKLGPASAYAIAVQNGFEGTQQEWLESLAVKEYADKTSEFEAQEDYSDPFAYLRSLGAGSWEVRNSTELYRVMAVDGGGTMYRTEMLLPDDGIPSYRIYAGEECIFSYDGGDLPELDGKRLLNETVVPIPTQENTGQVLSVGADGKPVWSTVMNAEEVAV